MIRLVSKLLFLLCTLTVSAQQFTLNHDLMVYGNQTNRGSILFTNGGGVFRLYPAADVGFVIYDVKNDVFMGFTNGLLTVNGITTGDDSRGFTNDIIGFWGYGAGLYGDNEVYGSSWNGKTGFPTKNAVYDKIETISGGASDGRGWDTNGNSGLAEANFVGTLDNVSLQLRSSNATLVRIDGYSNTVILGKNNRIVGWQPHSTIGGGQGNLITGATNSAFHYLLGYNVLGGGATNSINEGSGVLGRSFIGGGFFNSTVNSDASALVIVGGGQNTNEGSGGFIGGGYFNFADAIGTDSNANFATIPGGYVNRVVGDYGTASGGRSNTVTGPYGTVPGGHQNQALGSNSFAAGFKAQATHPGSFVWSDVSSASAATSQADNTFNIRAAGGLWLNGTQLTGGSPAGNNRSVQFNNSGAFGGEDALSYNSVTDILTGSNLTFTGYNILGELQLNLLSFDAGAERGWMQQKPDGTIQVSFDGSNLTNLNASALASGTVPDGRLTGVSHTNAPFISATNLVVQGSGPGSIQFQDSAGGEAVTLSAPSILASNYSLVLPTTNGAAGNVVTLGAAGQLYFGAGGSGSSPTTTRGDLIARGASADDRLAIGQVGATLKSDGTDPYWSTLSTTIEFKEEFFNGSAATIAETWAYGGSLNFGATGTADANHWGIGRFRSTGTDQYIWSGGSVNDHVVLGSGVVWVEWIIKTVETSSLGTPAVSDGTDTYTLLVGLGDTLTGAPQTDGVYFRYTHSVNSGKWERVTESNTSEEALDTGTTYAGATWIRLGIKITNGTDAEFFINGTSVGVNTTDANIPTGTSRTLAPLFMFDRTAGTAERNMYIDAFHLVFKPSTPR